MFEFEDTIVDIFRIPVMSIQTTMNVNNLLDYGYDLKSKTDGRHFSNVSGWQSEDLDRDLPVFKEFRKTVETLANQFHNSLKLKKCYTQILDNFWININPTGGSNKPHTHPGSVFSGVLYLQTPGNCGNLNFPHPNKNHSYHFNQDTIEELSSRTYLNFYHIPNVGKLVMFPSSVEHYVEGNCSNIDRVSIAFNTKFKE
jgi:uncharacterized protein (TIGR02466 family)